MSAKSMISAALFGLVIMIGANIAANAANPGEVRWHNEAADTTRITGLLNEAAKAGLDSDNARVEWLGRQLLGTPYGAGTLEGEPEQLTVNLDSLDCTTYVETVLALAITLDEKRYSWQDFVHNLEQLRYRQGLANGYASRLHYASDWVIDNSHRGLITDVTDRTGAPLAYMVKSLDFMTRNRDKYPALADSAQFARMKEIEGAYRNHRFPYVRSAALMGKDAVKYLKPGDVLLLATKTAGLDVSHMGIVVIENGELRLMHASSKAGKVVIDALPLKEYLKKNPSIAGARIIRLGSRN